MHEIVLADCLRVRKYLNDNSVDSIVCDPPYHLTQASRKGSPRKPGTGPFGRHRLGEKGFMGQTWDGGTVAFDPKLWRAVLRVAKPGAYLLAFGGTRTYHRLACAIEDAGWEIRDCIMWVYGCLSEDTEVLTSDGWELYHTAKLKEVLAYDAESDVYQWEKPERWSAYRVESDTAFRITSDSTDQIVSRNHRCLVEQGGKLAFMAAEELPGMVRVPTVSDDLSRLPQERSEELQPGMQRCPSWGGVGEARLQRKGGLDRGESPVLSEENDRAKQSGVEGRADLFQAQGQVRRSVDQVRSLPEEIYSDGSERRLRDGASAHNGEGRGSPIAAIGVCPPRQSRCDGQPGEESGAVQVECRPQEVRARPSYQTTLATVTAISYTGLIFCPTVSTGAFVARRNGKVFLTGNSGFPKSLDISKAIAKRRGGDLRAREAIVFMQNRRLALGITKKDLDIRIFGKSDGNVRNWEEGISLPRPGLWQRIKKALDLKRTPFDADMERGDIVIGMDEGDFGYQTTSERWSKTHAVREPFTDEAQQWDGWGTALKPAWEPIIVARKPLIGTVAANVLEHGTGGINVDGCRIATQENLNGGRYSDHGAGERDGPTYGSGLHLRTPGGYTPRQGRWPANLIHDGSDEVLGLFPQAGGGFGKAGGKVDRSKSAPGLFMPNRGNEFGYGDSGSAARFFYCAKPSRKERDEGCESLHKVSGGEATGRKDGSAGTKSPRAGAGRTSGARNVHPTVKSVTLMRWLCRLVTPPGGLVLDPFCGSGTTGVAAVREGFCFVGIEKEANYAKIAEARVGHAEA